MVARGLWPLGKEPVLPVCQVSYSSLCWTLRLFGMTIHVRKAWFCLHSMAHGGGQGVGFSTNRPQRAQL